MMNSGREISTEQKVGSSGMSALLRFQTTMERANCQVCRGWFTGGKGRKERCGKKARALQSVSILHVNVGLVAAWA